MGASSTEEKGVRLLQIRGPGGRGEGKRHPAPVPSSHLFPHLPPGSDLGGGPADWGVWGWPPGHRGGGWGSGSGEWAVWGHLDTAGVSESLLPSRYGRKVSGAAVSIACSHHSIPSRAGSGGTKDLPALPRLTPGETLFQEPLGDLPRATCLCFGPGDRLS